MTGAGAGRGGRRVSGPPAEARVRLHRVWLRELMAAWREVNRTCLGGQLKPPALQIDQAAQRLGRWEAGTRTIGISEAHIWAHPWHEVLSTLRHEIAHQYVDELLGGDSRPHGELFARACALLEISPAASANPDADAGMSKADKILRRVRKLLALAGSSNRGEAENAMAAANTLLLRYNLELPKADGAAANAEQLRARYGHRLLGRSAAALPLTWKLVSSILSEFFFVECLWVPTFNARKLRVESLLEVMGTRENLEMAEFVHDYLHGSVDRLWKAERARILGGGAGGVSARLRREFQVGVLIGFADKLRREREHNAEQGLIWLGDADLGRCFKERHPRTTSMRSASVRMSSAHAAGRAAGRDLTIHRPVHERGRGGPQGALPSGG